MLFTQTTLALLGLASLSGAHMIMNTPVPFGKSTLNNSPLDAQGADFPCKQRTGVYEAEGASNTMPLGSSQPLKFTGGATHGGGSCQISLTYDAAPTKNSVFKVIHSIEGGCPIKGVAGNNGASADSVDPSTYSFTIPNNLPTGSAVLAWTWFNKIGNREMYMNCAPVTITAGSARRSEDLETRNATQLMERDIAAFNALPDMFVANIPASKCTTQDSQDLKFPNPGESVEQLGISTATPVAPVGPACAAAAAGGSGSAPASSAPALQATAAPAASPTGQPGVFLTVPASSAAQPTVAPSVAPVASAAPSPVASAAPAAGTGTTGSGGAIAAGTACTTEGEWNCVGGTSFQQCASGTWSVVQQLAAGTKCTAGMSSSINIAAISKRAIRFSTEHIKRHLQRSHFA